MNYGKESLSKKKKNVSDIIHELRKRKPFEEEKKCIFKEKYEKETGRRPCL